MRILAFEFSTRDRSVAFYDSETGVHRSEHNFGEGPTPVFAMLEKVLPRPEDKGLVELIAVGIGPGSYTGIRVAISVALGWNLAAAVKLAGISSLQSLACEAVQKGMIGTVEVMADAHGGEFYHQRFHLAEAALVEEKTPATLISKDQAAELLKSGKVVIGPDIQVQFPTVPQVYPSAESLARLALRPEFHRPVEPIYLRETKFVKAPPSRVIA
jgi:tRNA threonylcarbamoyladenosine biosynthesis protein TsaB